MLTSLGNIWKSKTKDMIAKIEYPKPDDKRVKLLPILVGILNDNFIQRIQLDREWLTVEGDSYDNQDGKTKLILETEGSSSNTERLGNWS